METSTAPTISVMNIKACTNFCMLWKISNDVGYMISVLMVAGFQKSTSVSLWPIRINGNQL